MNFQISALDRAQFEHLFGLSDEELKRHNARRVVADQKPGFPCRVSLADAEIGEQVLLVHYEHQPAQTPFRSSHAIYVRPSAGQAQIKPNEVPEALRPRVLSLRGFDQEDMLRAADLADGSALERAIEQIFASPQVAYIHLHFAKPGCYAARVDRA